LQLKPLGDKIQQDLRFDSFSFLIRDVQGESLIPHRETHPVALELFRILDKGALLTCQLTRVNLGNILDEGLRIGGKGRRMNSKVKDQIKKAKLVMLLRQIWNYKPNLDVPLVDLS
jgi:hypothetical protein